MKRILLVAAVLAVLSLACAAQAAQVSYTSAVGPAPIDWTTAYQQHSLDVQQFNSALGTLNSVKIDFSGAMDISLSIFLMPNASMPTSASTTTNVLQMTLYNGATAVANFTLPNVSIDLHDAVQTKHTSGSAAQASIGDFAPFIGTGTLALPVVTYSNATSSGSGNGAFVGFTGVALANATVTYDYTAVPEPSSIIVLLGGLGSILAIRRRRA